MPHKFDKSGICSSSESQREFFLKMNVVVSCYINSFTCGRCHLAPCASCRGQVLQEQECSSLRLPTSVGDTLDDDDGESKSKASPNEVLRWSFLFLTEVQWYIWFFLLADGRQTTKSQRKKFKKQCLWRLNWNSVLQFWLFCFDSFEASTAFFELFWTFLKFFPLVDNYIFACAQKNQYKCHNSGNLNKYFLLWK